MSDLSEDAGLSQRYTNYSIQITGATNLMNANYTSKQITNVTSH